MIDASGDPARFHLAQLNVVLQRAPLTAPEMAEFMALLPPVNRLAETAPGFVWRFTDGGPDATHSRPYGDTILINLTVWESREALWDFTYRSGHLEVMRRRREWFHRMVEPHLVLWWIPAGQLPTLADAVARLAHLRAHGSGPEAFTFREPHPPPDALTGALDGAPAGSGS